MAELSTDMCRFPWGSLERPSSVCKTVPESEKTFFDRVASETAGNVELEMSEAEKLPSKKESAINEDAILDSFFS